jgi:zinc protease
MLRFAPSAILFTLAACSAPAGDEAPSMSAPRARTPPPAAYAARAQARDLLPFPATTRTLANGLQVIVVPTPFPNLVSLQIPVQTGSRNEVEPGKTGFAHFFEHMMFRGTEKYPPERYEEILTRAGARQNAYTSDDYTNYHVTFAKEDLAKVLEIEADRFQHLAYSEEAFRTEARAVLGEYNKNFANPIQKLFEVQRERAFAVHPYKHTTMGFIEDIEAMPEQIEYARKFFDRWYRPEYTTVVVVGDVDPARVIPLVERYFGGWERGKFELAVPREPSPKGPVVAHVPWQAPTQPLVTVAFHGPAFSETEKDSAALDLLQELHFGSTSDLYQRLVVDEQKVDVLAYDSAASQDPSLATIYTRLKDPADAVYVRDAILATVAAARSAPVDAERLEQAKSNLRYGFARGLDTSEAIASRLASYVRFRRSYDTLNNLFRLYESLTTEDLLAAGREYFTDERMVVTTLAHDPLPAGFAELPKLAMLAPAAAMAPDDGAGPAADVPFVVQRSASPQLDVKLLFSVGSADDPPGKQGLAALSAEMIAEAGSARMRFEEIQKALFPIAGSFTAQTDREMTSFEGAIHSDNWQAWADTVLPQLLEPGFRDEDFTRLRDLLRTALVQDLRANNDEELGKEVLQTWIFEGTPYGHTTLGTLQGIDSITLEDVRAFVREHYTRAKLTVGVAGDAPEGLMERLHAAAAALPAGEARPEDPAPRGRRPRGVQARIVQKETRATALSLGFPIDVVRGHPDFVPLYLARTWLGEHRSSMSHLYQRIREVRGMNYGDYAYIEAFPRGMFQFFPDANRARRAQIFEIWIRPVTSIENAHHALRIALHELDELVRRGMSREDFETTREYLSKNVFLMTARQAQQLGYALDSRFYGTEEFTKYMRDGLAKLTLEQVNDALRRHLQAKDVFVVAVTKDAEGLRELLVTDRPSAMTYEARKPQELLDEDALIGARKLAIDPDGVTIVPVEDVFAR